MIIDSIYFSIIYYIWVVKSVTQSFKNVKIWSE